MFFFWGGAGVIILTGCESHSHSLHPQCHPFHRWDPGTLPTLRSAGLPSAQRQPSGTVCLVGSRNVVALQILFAHRKSELMYLEISYYVNLFFF